MSDTLATPHRSWPMVMVLTVAGMLLLSTVALWLRYGTAVFFEMIRAGFVACFG